MGIELKKQQQSRTGDKGEGSTPLQGDFIIFKLQIAVFFVFVVSPLQLVAPKGFTDFKL